MSPDEKQTKYDEFVKDIMSDDADYDFLMKSCINSIISENDRFIDSELHKIHAKQALDTLINIKSALERFSTNDKKKEKFIIAI